MVDLKCDPLKLAVDNAYVKATSFLVDKYIYFSIGADLKKAAEDAYKDAGCSGYEQENFNFYCLRQVNHNFCDVFGTSMENRRQHK